LEGKPIGKRPLGKPRHRWEDSIRMVIGEIGWGDMDWIHLAENSDQWQALMNTVMNIHDAMIFKR
jgi:hypothetical protein